MIEPQITGTARIRPNADGTYHYDAKGQPATLLVVEDRYGAFTDILAWSQDPCRWWLRRGGQTPVLGARALAMAAWHGEKVKFYATPEGWLQAHSRADDMDTAHRICILQPGADLRPLLDGVSRVECENAGLEEMLRRALRAWEPKLCSSSVVKRRAA